MTTKNTRTTKATKATKSTKSKGATKATATGGNAKKLSALSAAAKGLGESKEPMNCGALIEAMAAKKLWSSPGGKTPAQTLYSAITREINTKGKESRFRKTERGLFTAKA